MRPAFPGAAVFAMLLTTSAILRGGALEEGFRNPPDSARPHTWWHWMNGNVSREGITADLEAMKRVGLGGFQAFHVTDQIPAGPVGYMSDAWFDLMDHTMREAERLGLDMCMHNCAGWSSSGGPWISPEQSMQELVFSEKQLVGGREVEVELPRPRVQKDFYRDVAVVAFPTPASENEGAEPFRLSDWMWKIDGNAKGRKPDSQIVRDPRSAPEAEIIKPETIVVLTDKLDAGGRLKWDVPEGKWTVLRFGHTSTGRVNKPAPTEGEGLECNKLDRSAVKWHWDHSMARVIERAGPRTGTTFNNVLIDSYEVGFGNWTPGLAKVFAERNGYELARFLPCFTGRVVQSVDASERALWDFRRLIADLMAENYFGYFREMAREKGMLLSIEPYGPGGFDDFQVAAIADIPMGEFWVDRADAWHFWSTKLASSAAHAGGKQFVGAEAFTARPPGSAWQSDPYALKPLGDQYFAQGLSRIIFHTNVHQPWGSDVLPGMTMGPHGMQMNRNNTWHAHARPWIDHLARTQFVLQQGRFVADLCYLASEDAPQTPLNRADLKPQPPAGYDYGMLHSSFVMQMSVKDGRLVLPSGMSYAVLVLPDDERMRPALLAKVVELKKAGAKVFSPRKITASPSLADQPAADAKVRELSAELGAGEALEALLPVRDVEIGGDAPVVYLHRRLDDRDVYFVANQDRKAVAFDAMFRAQGDVELWRNETGAIDRAADFERTSDGRTRLAMKLGPAESVFVVFVAKSDVPVAPKLAPAGELAIEGAWKLKFPPGWGAPEQVEWPKLISWTDHADAEIRHFSGTATYAIKFDVPAERVGDGKRAALDLGDVRQLAEVKLNGKPLGLLWKPPFAVDVTEAIGAGENELEVSVTNSWVNRLIGDEAHAPLAKFEPTPRGGRIEAIPQWLLKGEAKPPATRKTFATWGFFKADDALAPSGLMGPVRVMWFAQSTK